MTRIDVDVVVVGSGFAGSLIALGLQRSGRRVAMVERDRHPRFVIGESSTPLANLLLEELADRYDLPDVRAFSTWGTWQGTHPDTACGLKRGFTFLFHTAGQRFQDDPTHVNQLMVAASPHDAVADTHWYRPAFDEALVRVAQQSGVEYLDQTYLDSLRREGEVSLLDGNRLGRTIRFRAPFVVDASGPRGCLHRLLRLGETPLRWIPQTEGLYTHFEHVDRWDRLQASDDAPPYPPDDAALHHVFAGGWIWMLRFNNGLTSAGAALTAPLATAIAARDGAAAWARLLDRLPSVREQFARAKPALPFVHAPALAFRSARVCGEGWALLPSAAGVIDPLLSTGFPLTLLGVTRLLDVLTRTSPGPDREAALLSYATSTVAELEITERLVGALYASMTDAPLFKRLALIYFAAASFGETARRLGRPDLAPGFLLHAHPRFGPEVRACAEIAVRSPTGSVRQALLSRIDRLIEPFDTAGLLDRSRRDWYPVLATDLIDNAAKVEATTEDIHQLLSRCGFAAQKH